MKNTEGIIYFSSISYDHLFQRPQQLYTHWKKTHTDCYDFFYVDPPLFTTSQFVRAQLRSLPVLLRGRPAFRDPNRDTNRIIGWPCIPLEIGGFPIFQSVNRRFMRKALADVFESLDFRIAIVGAAFWEPFISKDNFDVICYDYLDAIDLLLRNSYLPRSNLRQQHRDLVRKSDLVVVTADAFRRDVLSIAKEKAVYTVSNGVDPSFFEYWQSGTISEEISRDRKVVGYVGSLDYVDFELVAGAAAALPDVDFILIGPSSAPVDTSNTESKNVFFLGSKPHHSVPAYINVFDVAIIPFTIDSITSFADPVKLYEYFALRKPVVSTRIEEVEKYANDRLLRITDSEEGFIGAIVSYLAYDDTRWQHERELVARDNTWSSKASAIIRYIEGLNKEAH